ncbi:guanylate kinase 1-like isoform X2 [Phalaenopsis equestris]|nr:guanylate kinase 1-like isoform X2 [Phalaenopsis equestris]
MVHDSESKVYETFTIIADKIYSIGGSEAISNFSINVKVFDKPTGTWLEPVVLGTKPVARNGYSSFLIDNERALILLKESSHDNSIWFLEVDTPFVKQKRKQLGAEVVAWSKGLLGHGSKPIVISGPSGVGKGTLIAKLMKEFPSTFGFSVSHTTRAPREHELNGVHYHFTERSKMEKDIQDGKFLESALVHGNLYGTSIEAVEAVSDVGKRCILDIDVQGARSVRASPLEATFIFVRPPSFEELEKRLRARGTEAEEQIQKRLTNARAELEQAESNGLFDHLLINDELESCYQNLKKLLALDETDREPSQPSMKSFMVPFSHSTSKADKKVIIHCGINGMSASSSSTKLILDWALLKGGAPGRTRGLNLYTTNL